MTDRQTTGRPKCTPESYLRAATRYLLKETPEQRAELLGRLDAKWRGAFDQEIKRQEAEAHCDR
jgi:hypothetical protein